MLKMQNGGLYRSTLGRQAKARDLAFEEANFAARRWVDLRTIPTARWIDVGRMTPAENPPSAETQCTKLRRSYQKLIMN